jgi:hypothetical protein
VRARMTRCEATCAEEVQIWFSRGACTLER